MGWTGERASRSEVVKRHAGPWESVEGATIQAIKHSRSSNEDWFLFQAERGGKVIEKFISLMIWEDGMHKEMDEICGPYYYGCPVEWFDEVPLPPYGNTAEWREEVRNRAGQAKHIHHVNPNRPLTLPF